MLSYPKVGVQKTITLREDFLPFLHDFLERIEKTASSGQNHLRQAEEVKFFNQVDWSVLKLLKLLKRLWLKFLIISHKNHLHGLVKMVLTKEADVNTDAHELPPKLNHLPLFLHLHLFQVLEDSFLQQSVDLDSRYQTMNSSSSMRSSFSSYSCEG